MKGLSGSSKATSCSRSVFASSVILEADPLAQDAPNVLNEEMEVAPRPQIDLRRCAPGLA